MPTPTRPVSGWASARGDGATHWWTAQGHLVCDPSSGRVYRGDKLPDAPTVDAVCPGCYGTLHEAATSLGVSFAELTRRLADK